MGFLSDIADSVGDALGGAADAVGDVVGGVGDAVGGVADGVGDLVGEAGDFAGDAFSWVKDNPAASALIGTAALGPIGGMMGGAAAGGSGILSSIASGASALGSSAIGALGSIGGGISKAAGMAGKALSNPGVANIAGGVVSGIGDNMAAEKQMDYERRLQQERMDSEKIRPGSRSGSYRNYRGLISEKMQPQGIG